MVFGWFKKKRNKDAAGDAGESRADLVEIERDTAIPSDAEVYFDPFDLEVRRRSTGRCPQYTEEDTEGSVCPVDEGPEQENEAHDVPEEWTDGAAEPATPNAEDTDPASPAVNKDDEALRTLIEQEKKCCEEMRSILMLPVPSNTQERYKQELELLRFLRARRYKVQAAVEQYKKMIQWRSENSVDTILDTPDPDETVFQCFCGHRNHGYSFEGHPVYFERTGLVKVAKMCKVLPAAEEGVIRRHIRHMEYAIRRCALSSVRHRRNVEKIIMVHDLKHLRVHR